MFLVMGALLSGMAAVLHVGCIVFGAPWYRFFGAGEKMAVLAEKGSANPAVITAGIVFVLSVWSGFALSGAGLLIKLPLLKPALVLITSAYLFRGVLGLYFIASPAMGNSARFWFWSSVTCLVIGGVHLAGLAQVWQTI